MAGAKIKPVESLKGHWTKTQLADRQEVQNNLQKNYDSIDETVPEELHGYARKEWQKIVPLLKKETPASNLDRSQLINYCVLAQTVHTCQKYILQDGLCVMTSQGTKKINPYFNMQDKAIKNMRAIASDFGLNISSRAKLENQKVKQQDPEDPFADFLEDGAGWLNTLMMYYLARS